MRCVPRFRMVAVLALAVSTACTHEAARQKPEHVLVILIDTLRADHTTPYGYSRDTSPAIAELASQGALFQNAISQCSWTLPSVVSLFTGQYLADERVRLPDDHATMAEVFKKAGFQTAGFICNDIVNNGKGRFDRGFDVFEQLPVYGDDASILNWFASAKGRRTFTYVHLAEPHDDGHGDYGPSDPKLWKYKRANPDSLPKGRLEFLKQFNDQKQLHEFDASLATIETEIGGYDDDVLCSDVHIRRYLDALKADGILDSTAIVLTADHGEGLWTREAYDVGQRRKEIHENGKPATLLNVLMNTHGSQVNGELIHVPLILKAPGVKPGTIVSSLVENVDIAPTVFDLCDLAAPNPLQGQSLLALAANPKSTPKGYVYTRTRYVSSIIDQAKHQLILPSPLGECELALKPELYDLAADPEARVDLAAQNPKLVEELTKIANERAKIGLPGESLAVDAETDALLKQLGYGDNGIRERTPDLSAIPTDELVKTIALPTTLCGARREIAVALIGRNLSADQRAKLDAWLAKEPSASVKSELAKVLAPK